MLIVEVKNYIQKNCLKYIIGWKLRSHHPRQRVFKDPKVKTILHLTACKT